MKAFLHDLQNSDPARKRRWLVGLTAAVMLMVVFAWGNYFSRLVIQPAAPKSSEQTFTFSETFRAGLGIVWNSLFTGIKSIGSIFGASKEIIIENNH